MNITSMFDIKCDESFSCHELVASTSYQSQSVQHRRKSAGHVRTFLGYESGKRYYHKGGAIKGYRGRLQNHVNIKSKYRLP